METLFRNLVRDHQQRLYRFVLHKISHAADAEDLTEQAFVEAAKAYQTYRGESELSTWLYGVAMNLVRNYLTRAPHPRYGFETEDALNEIGSDQADPSQQLAHSQAIRVLQREIDGLPEDMRNVLLMVAMDELSYEEAAVMLAVPVGTVRSRVSRARSTLRQRMAQSGVELDF